MKKTLNHPWLRIVSVTALVLFSGVLSGCSKDGEPNPDEYIELGQYKGLEIEKYSYTVTEEDIEEEIRLLLSSYATQEEITEGTVKNGDIANIDYEGKKDGVAFEGGTAKGYDLNIGSGTFIPGFEDGLVGVAVGDTVDINLTFPEEYPSAELAGQDVVFTVKVNSLKKENIPEATDEFINEISEGKFADMESYREALREEIKAEYDERNELQFYEDLWNMAVENATVKKDIPEDYIAAKTSKMVLNAQRYASSNKLSFDDFLEQYMGLTRDEFNKQAVEYAQTAAKESLVAAAIAKAEGIVVSEEELAKAMDEYAGIGNYESIEAFKAENDIKDLEEFVLLSKIEDLLAENAVIKQEQ